MTSKLACGVRAAMVIVVAMLVMLPGVALAVGFGPTANLPAGAPNTLSGHVRENVTGKALRCMVSLTGVGRTADSVSSGWTISAEDGSYMVTDLPAGQYKVMFLDLQAIIGFFQVVPMHDPQLWKYADLSYLNLVAGSSASRGTTITVTADGPGATDIDGSLSLSKPDISGRVVDSGGNPVTNVTATLYALDSPGFDSPGSTQWRSVLDVPVAPDGSYAFRGLTWMYRGTASTITPDAAAKYYVGFSDESSGTWNQQYFDGAARFSDATSLAPVGTEITGVNATLTPAETSVSGVVRDATTGNPIPGVTVSAESYGADTNEPPIELTSSSDASGAYQLKGMTAGRRYDVAAYRDGWKLLSALSPIVFDGTPRTSSDITMTPDTSKQPWITGLGGAEFGGSDEPVADALAAQFPNGYDGVVDVVVTAGDEHSVADAVSAPGLSWAYQVTKVGSPNRGIDAPVLNVPASGDPLWEAQAVADIGLHNGTADHRVALHVVGTIRSVPTRVTDRVRAYAARVGVTVTVDRLTPKPSATRHDVAAATAMRMKSCADASATDAISLPGAVLIANGDRAGHASEAAVCAAASASRGVPVLLVQHDAIPAVVSHAIKALRVRTGRIYIIGTTQSVSTDVGKALHAPGANRLTGATSSADRYTIAAAVASKLLSMGWARPASVAVATSPLGALIGAQTAGASHGVVLLAAGVYQNAIPATSRWLRSHKATIEQLWFVGWEAEEDSAAYTDPIWGSTLLSAKRQRLPGRLADIAVARRLLPR